MESQGKKRKQRASISENSPLDNPLEETFFSSTSETEATSPPPMREERQVESKTRTTSLKMYEYQLDWLDQKCTEARKDGGKAVRKAAIIRALVDLGMKSNVDLTGVMSDEELVGRFRAAVKKSE